MSDGNDEIVNITLKLDNPPHSISAADFERIWLMGWRAAGGRTTMPAPPREDADEHVPAWKYWSDIERMGERNRELVADLQECALARSSLEVRVRDTEGLRTLDPTVRTLLERAITTSSLNGSERRCLERWLDRSQAPSSAIAGARAALDRASTDFAELRVSIGLAAKHDDAAEGLGPLATQLEELDREGYDAGLRCSQAIDAIDKAVGR